MKGVVRSPASVIIFSVLTCGIYTIVWIYKFGSELKAYSGKEDLDPGLDLLLSIVCFPYIIYWSYKYGKAMEDAQKKAGIASSDDSLLYLILSLLGLFVVTMAIMQSNMNKVWNA